MQHDQMLFYPIDHYYIIIIFAPGVLHALPVGLKDFLFSCYWNMKTGAIVQKLF